MLLDGAGLPVKFRAAVLVCVVLAGCATAGSRTLNDYPNKGVQIQGEEGCFKFFRHACRDRLLVRQCSAQETRQAVVEVTMAVLTAGAAQPDYGATRWEFVGAAEQHLGGPCRVTNSHRVRGAFSGTLGYEIQYNCINETVID